MNCQTAVLKECSSQGKLQVPRWLFHLLFLHCQNSRFTVHCEGFLLASTSTISFSTIESWFPRRFLSGLEVQVQLRAADDS